MRGRRNTIDDVLMMLVVCEPGALEDGCLEWSGQLKDGYGCVSVSSREHRVHRLVYEHFAGPVPEWLDCHHRCENKRCANWLHVELLTPEEHARLHNLQEACCRGHALSGANLILKPSGQRSCRACKALFREERRRQRRVLGREHWQRELGSEVHDDRRCVNGHRLAEAGFYVRPTGERECRACKRAALQRSKRRS